MESKRKQNKSQKHRNREQKVVSTGKNGMEWGWRNGTTLQFCRMNKSGNILPENNNIVLYATNLLR
jgi:hypothetical protein